MERVEYECSRKSKSILKQMQVDQKSSLFSFLRTVDLVIWTGILFPKGFSTQYPLLPGFVSTVMTVAILDWLLRIEEARGPFIVRIREDIYLKTFFIATLVTSLLPGESWELRLNIIERYKSELLAALQTGGNKIPAKIGSAVLDFIREVDDMRRMLPETEYGKANLRVDAELISLAAIEVIGRLGRVDIATDMRESLPDILSDFPE